MANLVVVGVPVAHPLHRLTGLVTPFFSIFRRTCQFMRLPSLDLLFPFLDCTRARNLHM